MPPFHLVRTAEGNRWLLRAGLPDALSERLEALLRAEPVAADFERPPANLDAIRGALPEAAERDEEWRGPVFAFAPDFFRVAPSTDGLVRITPENADLLRAGFTQLLPEVERVQPLMARVEGGAAVSVCLSSRVTRKAVEAGMETLEAHRGLGYATQVTAAWAHAVRRREVVPL